MFIPYGLKSVIRAVHRSPWKRQMCPGNTFVLYNVSDRRPFSEPDLGISVPVCKCLAHAPPRTAKENEDISTNECGQISFFKMNDTNILMVIIV